MAGAAKKSLRDKILSSNDIKSEMVTVSEWDCDVKMKGLTGKQRARLLQDAVDSNGRMNLEKMYPELIIYSCFDPETDEQLFNIEDREILNTKSGGALEKLAIVAMRLSGLSKSAVDEAVKN